MKNDVGDVLYVTRTGEAPRADIREWSARGLRVTTCTSADFPVRPFHRLVVDGLDAVLAHTIERSVVLSATPIVVVCDQLDGVALAEDDQRAWKRFAADRRVSWLVRSEWHQKAAGLPSSRTALIPRGTSATEDTAVPSPRVRVLFPRPWSDLQHDAVDLFVRTLWLLRQNARFGEFEFVTRSTPVANWTADLPVFHGDVADIVFLPARMRSDEPEALHYAARGMAIVATDIGGVGEALPASALVNSNDPALFADALLAMLDRKRLTRLQREHQKFARARPAATQFDAEVNRVRAAPKRAERVSKKSPVLTVVVPAWNATPHLERCVHSLLRGTTNGLEVIVVDDGSTDGTRALADRLAAENADVVRVVTQPNRGHGGAINTGLAEARGTWFRVVDADDWVDAPAFSTLMDELTHERRADLLLTDYAEVRPELPLPRRVPLFERLPAGALCTFDGLTHPRYGLTSWGPILSTSTFRTELLRRAGLRLTENSAYVDLEYCTLGLEFVETFRALDLDLYRYSLGSETQTVSAASYGKRYRQHEAVITRLCEFVASTKLSPAKRAYIEQRVIAPVVAAHLGVLRDVLGDAAEERAFRDRMARFPFVEVPERSAAQRAREALKQALPAGVRNVLGRARRYFD